MAYIGQKPADKPLGASDITDGIISNSKLAQDIISGETELATAPADTDEFLISDAGVLKRIDASFVGGGGITEADMYRLTADSSNSNVQPLTAWERVDDATFSKIGTGVSVSSGIFSFASTGLYLVRFKASVRTNGVNDTLELEGTPDNSTYDTLAKQFYGVVSSGNPYQSQILESYFNCTNVSTHKIKTNFNAGSACDIHGDTNQNETTIAFIRLGDSQ